MAVNRFAEATVAGRCHADAPDCGCQWPIMEATLWMAYAQRHPDGMAFWLNKAAIEADVRRVSGQVVVLDGQDVARLVTDGQLARSLRICEERFEPTN